MEIFKKYVEETGKQRIPLLFLLLNHYDIAKVTEVIGEEEERLFGTKIRKIYGLTDEYVDENAIETEVEMIQNPIICSPQSFEYYSNSPVIHLYEAQYPEKSLVINDMNVISKVMMISENYVVSSNHALPLSDTKEVGFTYFMEYVLKSKVQIGEKWYISYQDKIFSIKYISKDGDIVMPELVYFAEEIDKTSTYKMVIYVIRKAAQDLDFEGDNFIQKTYKLAVKR